MRTFRRRSIGLMLILGISAVIRAYGQDYSQGLAAADTTRFLPNSDSGWQLYNSYVANYKTDSATVELIVQHKNNISLLQEQLLGKITYIGLVPAKEQYLAFNVMNTIYWLRIDTRGQCYLKLAAGTPPYEDPFVLPLKVFYQR